MAAAALRAKQAPIKDQYKSNPTSAVVTLSSSGSLDSSSITCKLDTGKQIHEAKQKIAGLHQKAGGDDPEISGELCSGDMLLEALVACAGVTLKVSCVNEHDELSVYGIRVSCHAALRAARVLAKC
jgi:hypothetical protein